MFQGYFLVEVMFQGYFFNCNRSVFKNWPPRPIVGQLKRINNDFDYDFENWPPRPIIGQLKQINNDFDYDFTVEVMRQPNLMTFF